MQHLSNKIKSRHSSEETERNSFEAVASAPPSVASSSLANTKRNQDFHALFRSVPEDDCLIEDFGCALQKEILLQGRIYVSENYLCFNANIFGWVTNLVIAFADIIDIEKKSTAYFIPNAIQVSTDNAKHFFASFLSRDQAHDLMVDLWRTARPDLIPCKDAESIECTDEVSPSSEEDSDSYYDSDTEDSFSAVDKTSGDVSDKPVEKPQLHDTTDCDCTPDHFQTTVMDQVYSGSLESLYNLLYHSGFMKKFLVENQKSTELTIGDWKNGEGNVELVRESSYIKQLNGSIGPKSTKCIITEEVLYKDFDKYITVMTTTATPDVPSGGSFTCKTRTCLTWSGKGKVRILVTVLVDFTKSSWLKSTIEKASIDGQQTYYKDLDVALRAYLKENEENQGNRHDGKRKKKGRKSRHHRIRSPTSSHLTLLCLVAMVCINVFIAKKMAFVEQQLNIMHPASDSAEQEVIWDSAIQSSKAAKDKLDRHMAELSQMILKAESNLEQVTNAVKEQRQKIKQEE
ncbi:GRAM domain-containing protein [Mucor mucedo]|uniref:GRAM domain-containing protein n=1 Tax=Mucor mucedo TaxID=29922 RepID=UPI00221F0A44|nr:GRAM domain-containing protein [Mucor mucedo]KAI7887724.1 GRAM domain-containing protein [Mucor mucedo]